MPLATKDSGMLLRMSTAPNKVSMPMHSNCPKTPKNVWLCLVSGGPASPNNVMLHRGQSAAEYGVLTSLIWF